jgi:hypothetical protein
MNRNKHSPNRRLLTRLSLLLLFCLGLVAAACGSSTEDASAETASETQSAESESTGSEEVEPEDESDADETAEDDHEHDEDGSHVDESGDTDEGGDTVAAAAVNLDLFFDGAIVGEVTTEPCTLSGGTETECYSFTVTGHPISYETGPFCPTTIEATADDVGLWLDGDALYDVDGTFILSLAELYGDDFWKLYQEDGTVNVTETAEEFELAAVPQVDESLLNHCVEGRVEWLPDGEPITADITIPVQPVVADAPAGGQGNWGVTLDGVTIAASAPVDAILGNYTIAAFDDCGGHYNPFEGYHLHGAVGCSEVAETVDGETAMFGFAMDGFPIHSAVGDDFDGELDECNGHTVEGVGYHYHANDAAENSVLTCLIGETAAAAEEDRRAVGPPADG